MDVVARQKAGIMLVTALTSVGLALFRFEVKSLYWVSTLLAGALVFLLLMIDMWMNRGPAIRGARECLRKLRVWPQSPRVDRPVFFVQCAAFAVAVAATAWLFFGAFHSIIPSATVQSSLLWAVLAFSGACGYLTLALRRIARRQKRFADSLARIEVARDRLLGVRPKSVGEMKVAVSEYCADVREAVMVAHGASVAPGLNIWLSVSHPAELEFRYFAIASDERNRDSVDSIKERASLPFFVIENESSDGVEGASDTESLSLRFGSVAARGLFQHVRENGSRLDGPPKFLASPVLRDSAWCPDVRTEYLSYALSDEARSDLDVACHTRSIFSAARTDGPAPVLSRAALFHLFLTSNDALWLYDNDQLLLSFATAGLASFMREHAGVLNSTFEFCPGELFLIHGAFKLELPPGAFIKADEVRGARYAKSGPKFRALLSGMDSARQLLEQFSTAADFATELVSQNRDRVPMGILVDPADAPLFSDKPELEDMVGQASQHPLGVALTTSADIVALASIVASLDGLIPGEGEGLFVACWPSSLASPVVRSLLEQILLRLSSPQKRRLSVVLRAGKAKLSDGDLKTLVGHLPSAGVQVGGTARELPDIDRLRELGGVLVVLEHPSGACGKHRDGLHFRKRILELAVHAAECNLACAVRPEDVSEMEWILAQQQPVSSSSHVIRPYGRRRESINGAGLRVT